MLEYNLVGALTKLMLLRYSRKGLKPSLFVELEYQDLKQENFDQMVQKKPSMLRPKQSLTSL
ncbi:hypothetical protein CK516_32755 [Nostoc sp. 'Peltigera malacea cyanobiont' DB3992]|nr:hypothetical protein CK516_32755 [Nostoc sp. 'Peltigera malacea cyanobiont' DB3992]